MTVFRQTGSVNQGQHLRTDRIAIPIYNDKQIDITRLRLVQRPLFVPGN